MTTKHKPSNNEQIQQLTLFSDDTLPETTHTALTFANIGSGTQTNITGNVNLQLPSMPIEQLQQLLALFGNSIRPSTENNSIEIANLDYTHYNLFVIENETFTDDTFSIYKEAALLYTNDEYNLKDANDLKRIENYPCVFASRNQNWRTAADNCPVFIGKIVQIIPQGSVIKFRIKVYNRENPLQALFNEDPRKFGLYTAPLHNELDEPHWAIKSVNLKDALGNNYDWR